MAAVPFPLVEIRSIANGQNEWVALLLGSPDQGLDDPTLQRLFGTADLLTAVAPLDCVLLVDSTAVLTQPVLNVLPPNRVLLAVRADALAADGAARRLAQLQMDGYRVLIDGPLPDGIPAPLALRSLARDIGTDAIPPAGALPALFGPHLAYGIATTDAFGACETAGFAWFSGDYVQDSPLDDGDDGSSRRRLLTMLALLARDADTHELEQLLKQDAALSYHLLKLVNSAAFSGGTTVHTFAQAITRLGRRQLQRWLQLLLYTRPHPDSPPNLMLPLAALRGAMLEALCKHDDCDRDEQDQAFMAGVFSLLDRLFGLPMDELVRDLNLPEHVEAALLRREGQLGLRLRLLEGGAPDLASLAAAGVEPGAWWDSQLHAYHWAIQVARNV